MYVNCVYTGDDTDINANNTSEDKQANYFQDSNHISMHEPSTTELVPLTIFPSETNLQYEIDSFYNFQLNTKCDLYIYLEIMVYLRVISAAILLLHWSLLKNGHRHLLINSNHNNLQLRLCPQNHRIHT